MKNINRMFVVVDTHVGGEAARVILSGVPYIKAASMMDIKKILTEKYDYIRRTLMMEPRGHRNMFGSIVFPPISAEADLGVVYIDANGYVNMCGHATLGTAAVAAQLGLVEFNNPIGTINIDTPVGIVEAEVRIEKNKIEQVSIINVPSFLFAPKYKLGDITLDIVFGGDFFALVDVSQFNDLTIEPTNVEKFIQLGMQILNDANKAIKVQHPVEKNITYIDSVEFYDTQSGKNVVIFGDRQVDRSPCGVGTSAKMALMHANGELKIGEEYIQKSIINTTFKGEILGVTKVGDYDAIIPRISGKPYIIGMGQIFVDDEDDLSTGFLL